MAKQSTTLTAEELFQIAVLNREWAGTVKNAMNRVVPEEGVDLLRVITPEHDVYVVEYKVVEADETETLVYNIYPCGSEPLKG